MKWHNIRNGVNIIHRRRREEEPYPHFTLPRFWSIAESSLPSSLIPEKKTNHNADSEYLCFHGVPYATLLYLQLYVLKNLIVVLISANEEEENGQRRHCPQITIFLSTGIDGLLPFFKRPPYSVIALLCPSIS